MRLAALGLLGLFACSGAIAAGREDKLTISVDLSEWTPSQTLELNLASGDYVVTPPATGWPKEIAMPPRHEGRLEGRMLESVRQLSKRAFASGVNHKDCAAKLRGGPPPPPHAVGPEEFTLSMGGVAIKSERIYCLTDEASAMFSVVTKMFDNSRP